MMDETGSRLADSPKGAYIPPPSRARDLAYSGVFGAAALLLPSIFHLFHLGRLFMPMYLPLMVLPFLVRPAHAAATALLVPLLSALLTGMPTLHPPMAVVMALELATMTALAAGLRQAFPRLPVLAVLAPVLLLGRGLHAGMVWGMAQLMTLPADFLARLSLLAGWPGILLMLTTIPVVVAVIRARARPGLR